jgi:hypothetical protein
MDCPDDPMGCPDPDVDYGGEVIAWGSATSIGADDDQVFWSGVDPSFREGGVHGEIRRLHAIRCRTLSPTTLTPTPGQCPIRQDRALATVASGHQRGPGQRTLARRRHARQGKGEKDDQRGAASASAHRQRRPRIPADPPGARQGPAGVMERRRTSLSVRDDMHLSMR